MVRTWVPRLMLLSDSNHGCVCGPERKVAVGGNQLGHPRVVAGGELDARESAIGQRLEEQGLNLRPGFTSQEVPDLCDHSRRNQEFPAGGVRLGLTEEEYVELDTAAAQAGMAKGAYAAMATLAAARGLMNPADSPFRQALTELIRAAGLAGGSAST